MAPAARTRTLLLSGLRRDVVNDGVRTCRIAAHSTRNKIEAKVGAGPPADVVIGARGITAYTESAHDFPARVVQREAAAKDIDAADLSATHWIVGGTVVRRITAISDRCVDRIAVLKPVQRAARRHSEEQISRRQS